jgi:hypothetical protein
MIYLQKPSNEDVNMHNFNATKDEPYINPPSHFA